MNITIFYSLLFLCGLMAMPDADMNQIEKNGMKICWKVEREEVHFKVFAPTQGWVAIGLNEQNKLVGSNLIMGAVDGDKVAVSDRYIVGFGDHRAVEKLDGISHLSNMDGIENSFGTTIEFSIKRQALDAYHYDLKTGKSLHLLIAYSIADEFEHHSRMRTSVSIVL